MDGLQLRKYLEWSASYYNLVNSDDLTISFNKDRTSDLLDVFFGIDYEIDISSEIGSRIKTLKWSSNSNLVKDEDIFILAVNNIRATNQLLIQAQNNNDISTGVFNTSDEVAKLVDISIYNKEISTILVDYVEENIMADNDNKTFSCNNLVNNWKLTG